jgi:hypothetical protein
VVPLKASNDAFDADCLHTVHIRESAMLVNERLPAYAKRQGAQKKDDCKEGQDHVATLTEYIL